MSKIKFILNGQATAWEGNKAARLLDVLREELDDTSVKCGCKEGECGDCSVIIDGKLANSCMVAMGRIEGSEVITVKGFKKCKCFKVLSDAYGEVSAVQCGFCIPGMILASECILNENPHPTEAEIIVGISRKSLPLHRL